ncbi:MAG: MarR family transcriptional regulator [Nocardioides sp.]
MPPLMDPDTATRLARAISRLARQLNASSTTVGLSPAQASVLGLLVARGPMNPTGLAEVEGINPTMLSRVVGKLETMGLVERSADPDDQRSSLLEATASGRRADRRVKLERAQIVSRCLDALEEHDVVTIGEALSPLERLAMELNQQTRRHLTGPRR